MKSDFFYFMFALFIIAEAASVILGREPVFTALVFTHAMLWLILARINDLELMVKRRRK